MSVIFCTVSANFSSVLQASLFSFKRSIEKSSHLCSNIDIKLVLCFSNKAHEFLST